jgi:predicted PurR-regulated permease PerM
VSAVSVFLIAVLVLLFAVLVAFVIVIYQNMKRLARTVSEFQREVQPIVEDISREAGQASVLAAKLSENAPGKEPGDKIRR